MQQPARQVEETVSEESKMKIFTIFIPILSALIFGLVFYKILPPYFIFFGFIPFLVFLDRERSWKLMLLGGFLAGFVYFAMILYFATEIRWFGFLTSEILFMRMGYVVASVVGGLWWALFSVAAYRGWRRHWSMMFFIPALWILMEFLRRLFAFGFTWGFLGYLTEDLVLFRQSAVLAGVLGLGFLIIFINVGIFLISQCILKKDFKNALFSLSIFWGVLVLVFFFTNKVQASLHLKDQIRVAVLQANLESPVKNFQEEPYNSLLQEARAQNPDLIVMPESIITQWNVDSETSLTKALGDFPGIVAFGAYRQDGNNLYNSFLLWERDSIIDVYDKHYLVQFAEYRPPFLSRFTPQTIHMFTPGAMVQSFKSESMKLGVFVCQESMHPESVQRSVLRGAEVLVSGANDGAGGYSELLQKISPEKNNWLHLMDHLTSKFRAIENGRYLARSTKIGIASIIAPSGEEIARADPGQQKVLSSKIHLIDGLTPYTRFGDALLFTGSLFLIGWRFLNKKKRGKEK